MEYTADKTRYDSMVYNRCGRSGLKLPPVSLGLWHNFGGVDSFENSQKMIYRSFDLGITHFDLANNYGPPIGSAEETLGKVLKLNLKRYRDELIISTKAGWQMWSGPYGDYGSKKYLIASLDQSLKRMGLDYVDIFYHHRPDNQTPLYETMCALDQIVRSGKALYIGISSYNAEQTRQAAKILKKLGTPCLIHQPLYNMFERSIEKDLLYTLKDEGIGCIVFSPLAQGLLTNKYLSGIPKDSRAANKHSIFLKEEDITKKKLAIISKLNSLAESRGQSLAQMSVAWCLRLNGITSCLVGASSIRQIEESYTALNNLSFSDEEISNIDLILKN